MRKPNSLPASLASQKGLEDRGAREEDRDWPHLDVKTASDLEKIAGLLGSMTRNVRHELCPMSPSTGPGGCFGCNNPHQHSVSATSPAHGINYWKWINKAADFLKSAADRALKER